MRMETMGDKRILWCWVDRFCRWGVGCFFIAVAMPKLFDVHGFAAVIAAYGMLPKPLLLPIAVILPLIELFLAVGLIMNRLHSKIGIALLLIFFIAVLSYSISIGLDIDCGCFGPEDPESKAFHGLKTALVRDFVMLLPLAFSFWWHRSSTTIQLQGETRQ